MTAKGSFDIKMTPEPPYETVDGVSLGRAHFLKRFSGPLTATSEVHMLAARTAVPNSAGYVAIERVTGNLDGKTGTFVLQHSGVMTRGESTLSVTVVPDSGTGELAGLSGSMRIEIANGAHFYEFEYTL